MLEVTLFSDDDTFEELKSVERANGEKRNREKGQRDNLSRRSRQAAATCLTQTYGSFVACDGCLAQKYLLEFLGRSSCSDCLRHSPRAERSIHC